MSEADTSNQQSLSLTSETNSANPSGDMVPATAATQSLSQQGIQGIDPTHNLISRNRNLLQQVGQLEQALRQYQEELQFQQARAQTQETLLLQHKELLKASEDQVNRLFKELESSHQVNQRQQILIETLSTQLETAQERLAQLERDCALTQQRYQEQSHQLQHTETTCEELQVRLERQQQQTLQFKAALEKSLEVSTSSYFNSDLEEVETFPLQNTPDIFSASNPLLGELSEDLELLSSDYQNIADWEHLTSPGFDFISLPTELETEDRKITTNSPTSGTPSFDSKVPLKDKSQSVNLPHLPKQSSSAKPTVTLAETAQFSADPPERESFSELSEIADTDLIQEVLKDLADIPQSNIDPAISAALDQLVENEDNQKNTHQEVTTSQADLDDVESESLLSGASWPSPLVNPLRPTKRLKSWAAIDLPRFPRFRRSSQ
ncbi:hypothetical protein [Merismopedia glauca]|uniref:Uncharacterized protein n=1 Tax=Merismopedia glauca CCAP 1448/3 TaxID=1296344 RepID=A0A2T1BYZ1_9CYAN|nr:hypothetical protein [Merismopedia glauca]PSB01127.1 hypothetical protein C7B64_19975 [Merismopedia glauca CCAP 1448/3]